MTYSPGYCLKGEYQMNISHMPHSRLHITLWDVIQKNRSNGLLPVEAINIFLNRT